MTRSVLIAVSPTYWPTSPARSTSTRCPRLSSPIERYICASSRATVVLPVPGLPRKTRCCVVATSGSPASLRRACTRRNATSARTCSFTVSSPAARRAPRSSSSSGRAGSWRRSRSMIELFADLGAQLVAERLQSLEGIRSAARPKLPGVSGSLKFINGSSWLTTPSRLANRLRPVLLRLARELRREIHSLGVTGGQVSLLSRSSTTRGSPRRELADRERVSAPGMSGHLVRLEAANLSSGSASRPPAHRPLPDTRRREGAAIRSQQTHRLARRRGSSDSSPPSANASRTLSTPWRSLMDE